MATPLLQK